jgi:hypothetical protein
MPLSRPVKWVLLSLALLAGFFEHDFGRWAAPIAMAAIALVVPILLYRTYWGKLWFWITALLLAVVQIPLVMLVRPLIEQSRAYYMLVFGMVDLVFVAVVMSLIMQLGT